MALVGNLRLWSVEELVSRMIFCIFKRIHIETVRNICENFQYRGMGIFVHILSSRIGMYRIKKRDRFQQRSFLLEGLNLLLSLITILLGIVIFLNLNTMLQWLAVMFFTGAIVNLIGSMDAFYYGKKLKGIGYLIASFLIFAFGVVSYITFWM